MGEQAMYLDGPHGVENTGHVNEYIKQLKAPTLSESTPSTQLPFGVSAKQWLDFRSYDPIATAKMFAKPILILQGESDHSVINFQCFSRWQHASGSNKQFKLKLYPNLEHMCLEHTLDFEKPAHVHKQLIDDIARWIPTRKE